MVRGPEGTRRHDGAKMTPPTYNGTGADTSTRMLTMPDQASKRLTTRVSGSAQQKLQIAADLVGATVNQFVVQAAIEKANRIIESESVMLLSPRESARLLELIDNPPARNRKFLEAKARYERMKGDADSSPEQAP